jgi:DNA-binding IclR family transcriptional regulator
MSAWWLPIPTHDPDAHPGSVAVLAKATAILERLASEGELSPGRMSELIGEPRSTVYRLISTLQKLGYVEPGSRRGTYRLTLKLFDLGSAAVSRFDERAAALPVMQRLHDETGETIFLCVRRGLDAVCIERIDGARVMLLELRLGGSLPLHLGAAPRCLLAFEPQAAWDDYLLSVELRARTPNTPVTREAIAAELTATRERGYAISDQDVTVGVVSIGAPIFDHTGRVCASLSIGGLPEVIHGEGSRAQALVVDGAAEISRALGNRP